MIIAKIIATIIFGLLATAGFGIGIYMRYDSKKRGFGKDILLILCAVGEGLMGAFSLLCAIGIWFIT